MMESEVVKVTETRKKKKVRRNNKTKKELEEPTE